MWYIIKTQLQEWITSLASVWLKPVYFSWCFLHQFVNVWRTSLLLEPTWTIKIYPIFLVNRLLTKDECQLAFVLSHIFYSVRSQNVGSMPCLNSDLFPTDSETHWRPDSRELLHLYNYPLHTSLEISNKFNYKRNRRKYFFISTARKRYAVLGNSFIASFDLSSSNSHCGYFKY